jgi:hypothetical protein
MPKSEIKHYNITIRSYDYTCGDGCCFETGTDVFINHSLVTSFADIYPSDIESNIKEIVEGLDCKATITIGDEE